MLINICIVCRKNISKMTKTCGNHSENNENKSKSKSKSNKDSDNNE